MIFLLISIRLNHRIVKNLLSLLTLNNSTYYYSFWDPITNLFHYDLISMSRLDYLISL